MDEVYVPALVHVDDQLPPWTKLNLIPRFSRMSDIVPHGNIQSYLSHALDESSYLKALVKQLGTVTKDVDPEQGYASTLLNLNKRMLMSENLLAKGLGIKLGKVSATKSTGAESSSKAVKSAGMEAHMCLPSFHNTKERSRNFL